MEHAPLASFANGVLSTFNELRHCAPVTLAPTIASIVQACVPFVSCSALLGMPSRCLSSEGPQFKMPLGALH